MPDRSAHPDKAKIERFVLPDDCVPVSYDLTLRPDLDACTFTGAVEILLDCEVSTNEISLNIQDLLIDT